MQETIALVRDALREIAPTTNSGIPSTPQLRPPAKLAIVTFAVTTDCNLLCKGCGRTKEIERGTWQNEHMRARDFERIIANLPPMATAMLQGIGEPTLNPDFGEICRIARQSGKADLITFHTNGITREPEFFASIAEYIDQFAVSVDTLNQAYVENTRKGTIVKKLHQRLVDLKRLGLDFRINMVASRYNFHDIPSTLKILNDIGQMRVHIQPLESEDSNDFGVLPDDELVLLRALLEAYQHYLPHLSIDFPQAGREARDDQRFCSAGAPAFAPYVLPQGFITPCCRSNDPSMFGHGNLVESSFEQIWTSQATRKYLHRFIAEGDPMCDGCYESRRSATSKQLRQASPDARAKNTLLPAINFALSLGDPESAARFCSEFLDTFPENPGAAQLTQQLRAALSSPAN